MLRKTVWRKAVSDLVNSHQHRALNTTIFILKEFGPIGFLLQEDGESKKYKVCLGDPHTCTCPTFQKEKDLCTHICWILMRKFRLPRDHEYCFQYGLAERQILELLQGLHVAKITSHNDRGRSETSRSQPSEEEGGLRPKAIGEDDICPICQEELFLKKLPVTYCKFSCGNNIHISCMKVWADHQTKINPHGMIKCPLCREDFGTFKELTEQVKNAGELCTYYEKECLDKHLGVVCNGCRVVPIVGKCFKCTECSYFHLCEECFKKITHPQHCFIVRKKRGQSWQAAPDASEGTQKITNHSMEQSSMSGVTSDLVPNHVMKNLTMVRVRKESKLLHPGAQCRMCLSRFQLGQNIRYLPCKHKFHTGCIDPLIQRSNCCPLDWYVIYNPLTWNVKAGRTESSLAPPGVVQNKCKDQQQIPTDFFLPGIGIQVQKGSAPSLLRSVRPRPCVTGCDGPSAVKSLTQGFQDLCINSSHVEPYSRKPVKKLEPRTLNRGLSFGQAISAPAQRRASYSSGPSTCRCLNICSALTSTQIDRDQQRITVDVNEPSSMTTACGRIEPLRVRPLKTTSGMNEETFSFPDDI
ncbi:E3 ubiquitin-protein ligase ZSWIM2 isoform X1 [Misgurnus anguillicaudatus]|uniref:E3 ubiquitin-protein ligase ZSWIM2 isoform X1 n=2 Tax=Misgurnus anguillicaudatus TaxID=75329 RepID=UPI003CCF0A84